MIHSDGTRVSYSAPGSHFGANDYTRDHYPTTIQDSNGNQINISYLSGTDKIQAITDTLGREIKFYYENPTGSDPKLVAVTVPGFGTSGERQTIRFYYEDNVSLTHQGRFDGTVVAPDTYRALRYVYFPATQSGYRYDYQGLGMIGKITKLMGMTVSTTALNATGTITSNDVATTAATTQYNYVSDGSTTPLTNVPKFNQRTDVWRGPAGNQTSTTGYDSSDPGGSSDVTTTVTVSEGTHSVEYQTIANSAGYTTETSVTEKGPNQFPKVMSKTKYFWDIKPTGNFGGAYFTWLKKIEVTNDANQTRATEFDVDDYNNTKLVRECEIAAPGSTCSELRRAETSYITGANWTNNQLLRLPEIVTTKVGATVVSKTVFAYDESSQLQETPGVVHHDPAYNPNQGTHTEWHWECNGELSPPRCPDGTPADHVPVEVPNADPRYYYRGNVTRVTSFSDATLPSDSNANVRTMEYDMTGNMIKVHGMSCCNVKAIEYTLATQFAYPAKETKGLATQLETNAVYDVNTGLIIRTKDENDQRTDYSYDPDTLRQTRVDYPSGAWVTFDVNNTQFPYHIKTTSSLDSNRSVASWSFFDGAGLGFRSRSLTANGYLSSDVEFDSAGRVKRTFNPYTVAALDTARPGDIKSTEASVVDGLGRVTETTLPDGTKTYSYPNEAAANYTSPGGQSIVGTASRVKDQAGKERRQIVDAFGRIVRVDEPDSSGNLGSLSSPAQPTYYDFDGNDNLSTVTQIEGSVTQERVFEYDSLSRLLRERQVEAIPTLDAAGAKGASSPTKWTGVYKYTGDGLLDWGVDARGVKTKFSYDGLNRVEKVEYEGEVGYTTPIVDYVYDEARTDPVLGDFYNKGRLTTVSTREISVSSGGQFTPKTIQKLDYDRVGQVVNHNQTIDQQNYNLQYGYNLAGQLTSEKYPSGKIVNMTVDNFGVVQTIADSQRTYVSGVTCSYTANGMTSHVTLGNGTVESFTFNERFQLTSQNLMRGSEVLQKYNYNYGDLDASSNLKNNGKLEQIESYIGSTKQWTQNFRYDSIGRLKESAEKRGDNNALTYKQMFDYDRFGNLYRKTGSNPTTGQANPIPFIPIEDSDINRSNNRFSTGTTYDEAGQVTTDNKFRSMGFSYDANGRVVKATKASTPDATTVYDALGNRVATKINDVWQYMIYDKFGQLVAEYGTLSEGMGGLKYVQQDHQGSVRTISNASGFVVSRTDHQAFGEAIGTGVGLRNVNQGYSNEASTRQSYGLTEKDDSSGQHHTWFRKLETQAGRWSSPDPYKGSMTAGDPQTFNRYSYVGNEPVKYVDPSGLLPNDGCPSGVILPDGTCYVGVVGTRVPRLSRSDITIHIFGGYLPPRGPMDPPATGGDPEKPEETSCIIRVNKTSAGSFGNSFGGSQNAAHLFVTTTLSIPSEGVYETRAYRAGPQNKTPSNFGLLRAFDGRYNSDFADYPKPGEPEPTTVHTEAFPGSCERFDASFQKTTDWTDFSKIQYGLVNPNSNSFVYTLLNRAGINTDAIHPNVTGWGFILRLSSNQEPALSYPRY